MTPRGPAEVPVAAWSRVAARYDLQLRLERPALDAAVTLAAAGPQDRLLDVGTGTGALLARLARMPRRPQQAIGIDGSSAMLARVPPLPADWRVLEGDARALPLPAAGFDVVTMAYLLQTLATPTRHEVLSEARRVLRPGGRLVTVTPSLPQTSLLAPLRTLEHSSRPLAGLRPLDPVPDLRRAGLEPLRALRLRRGYPSLCILATR